MKFMAMVSSDETVPPPPPSLMMAIMKLGEEATKAGVLVEQGGLMKSATGIRVRVSRGKVSVIDGPFSESKEKGGGVGVDAPVHGAPRGALARLGRYVRSAPDF